MSKYRVMTKVSSFPDGRPLLHECDNLAEAERECAEWAEYDDIKVWVVNEQNKKIFTVNGYAAACEILYPEDEEMVDD